MKYFKVLMQPWQNPRGLALVLDENSGFVSIRSGCCYGELTLDSRAMLCKNCDTQAVPGPNPTGGYVHEFNATYEAVNHPEANRSEWNGWGRHWFGIEEFEMEITP